MGGLFTSELFGVLNDTGIYFRAGQMYSPLITEIRNKSLNLLGIFTKITLTLMINSPLLIGTMK